MPGPFTSVHTLSWNANVETDLAGYFVYVGRASGVYGSLGSPINVGNVTSYDLTLNDIGAWYFTVSAYDSSANEGAKATEISKSFLFLGNF